MRRLNHNRGSFDGCHKGYQSFIHGRFKYLIEKHKTRFSWLSPNRAYKDYSPLTKWFIDLSSKYRSLSIVRLAFIDNYGHKDNEICLT